MFRAIRKHTNIIGALLMREIVTRYGRESIGFLWLIAEPLMFCFGVMILWTLVKPEYEHGVRVAPFVMTGYMCIVMFRHIVSYSSGALQANVGLLHHKVVRPLHIYISRGVMELAGSSMAFVVVYATLYFIGVVDLPHDYLLLYSGWFLLAWLSTGFAMTIAALSIRYEFLEKVLPVTMYIMVPLSGAFVMVDWIPSRYRELYLLNPLPHTIEMVRSSVFGEFVHTHFNPVYPVCFAAILSLTGLLLLTQTTKYLEVE